MSRVLQLIGSFHQGGSERQAVQLTGLLRADATHQVFAAALNKEGVLLREIERLDLPPIPEFKLTSFYDANFVRQLKSCARYIRKNKIEIVHTHDFYTNVFGIAAARLAGARLKIASKRETGGMRSRLQKIIEKRIFKSSEKIVANAEAVREYLVGQGISDDKIKVIYNGLDLERLKPKTTNRKEICTKLGLPAAENIKFITLVANLRYRVKNHAMLLRAAAQIIPEFPNAHFVIAGEGELKAELEAAAKELNVSANTHFVGRCEAVPELLAVSEICTLTSFNEGFSNSILEYMAAGKPVVATRVGGAAEAIIDGENGFLIDSDDDAQLAARLKELLSDEKKTRIFGENGRRLVQEKFSLRAQLEKTLELYRF